MTGKREYRSGSLTLRYCQALPSNDRGHVRELSGLFVPEEHRSSGVASTLMRRVCAEADFHDKTLMLLLDDAALTPFYLRFGFDLIQTDPVRIMRRTPKVVNENY
jgi:predicted N-acetyltransferase YhbS